MLWDTEIKKENLLIPILLNGSKNLSKFAFGKEITYAS